MTLDERAAALEAFGYTPRQARFLTRAALHGGYFLRRQYGTFTGRRHGAPTVEFLRRTTAQSHVTVVSAPILGRVYHVAAKAIYASLQDEHNRNRRLHSAPHIRRRLMAFDYVLAHPDRIFLATEREKVTYFTDHERVPIGVLPAVPYASKDGRSTTTRYFVEKLPIAADTQGVTLAYVDDDDATGAGFASFLTRHRPLLTALTVRTEVVFITTVPTHIARASALLARDGSGRAERRPPERGTLVAYVRARQRVEQGRLVGCPQHELDVLRAQLAAVERTTGDAIYRRWHVDGDAAIDAWMRQSAASPAIAMTTFRAYVPPYRYGSTPGAQSYHG